MESVHSSGHIWQGRLKAFPTQEDEYFLTVLRYIERNRLGAGLVERAEAWPWSSLRWPAGPAGAGHRLAGSRLGCGYQRDDDGSRGGTTPRVRAP